MTKIFFKTKGFSFLKNESFCSLDFIYCFKKSKINRDLIANPQNFWSPNVEHTIA